MEAMDFLMQFLAANFYILAAALWVLGAFLKATPKLADWAIPYILLLVSFGLGVCIIGFSPQVILQGIIATGIAVLADQLVKQLKKRA